jgi:CRP/FNR family cyclic AMP-dependent transcriptional regulator
LAVPITCSGAFLPADTPAAQGYVYKQLKRLGLSDALALQTAPMVKVQAFDAGKRLWSKGSEVKQWMFIIQGLVSASVPTTNSESTPISVYGRGAWFGEQSIINRKPSFADYVCLTATEVLTLPAAQFDHLFVTEPNFARFVAKLMAWRVQKTSETLTLMKLGNPCMRVVMGLAQFAEALAYRSDRPPTIGFGEGVEIPIPQNTLASLCGVSRTLFSEYVQQLATHGWLKLSYGKLEILSIHTWHAFARSQREDNQNTLNASIPDLLALLERLDRA